MKSTIVAQVSRDVYALEQALAITPTSEGHAFATQPRGRPNLVSLARASGYRRYHNVTNCASGWCLRPRVTSAGILRHLASKLEMPELSDKYRNVREGVS